MIKKIFVSISVFLFGFIFLFPVSADYQTPYYAMKFAFVLDNYVRMYAGSFSKESDYYTYQEGQGTYHTFFRTSTYPYYKVRSNWIGDFSYNDNLAVSLDVGEYYLMYHVDLDMKQAQQVDLNSNLPVFLRPYAPDTANFEEVSIRRYFVGRMGLSYIVKYKISNKTSAVSLNVKEFRYTNNAVTGYQLVPIYFGKVDNLPPEVATYYGIVNDKDTSLLVDLNASIKEGNEIAKEGNEIAKEGNEIAKETNDLIKNDDVTQSGDTATDFFEGFDSGLDGIAGVVSAPLETIGNIVGSGCSPLALDLPYVGKSLQLPCMGSIYTQHFGDVVILYNIIVGGFLSYRILISIFATVKGLQSPDNDKVEVIDL